MKDKLPNIVLIFSDNQQASTLGLLRESRDSHPPTSIDLRRRASHLTTPFVRTRFALPAGPRSSRGLLPSQHGVHSWIDDRENDLWPENWHALNGLHTFPTVKYGC